MTEKQFEIMPINEENYVIYNLRENYYCNAMIGIYELNMEYINEIMKIINKKELGI